jgi:hypothetical protein
VHPFVVAHPGSSVAGGVSRDTAAACHVRTRRAKLNAMSKLALVLRRLTPVVVIGALVSPPAMAVDLAQEATAAALPNAATPVAVSADLLGDPAWRLVRDAMSELAKGDSASALGYLDELRQRFAGHPAVRVSEAAFTALDGPRRAAQLGFGSGTAPAAAGPHGPETPSKLARAELVSTQSLAGLSLGIAACIGFDCDSARTAVGVNLVTVGAGLGGSLYASRDGITAGQATAVNSGTLWGLGHGLILQDLLVSDAIFVSPPSVAGDGSTVVFEDFDAQRRATDRNKALTVIGSQLVGTGVGTAVAHFVRPKAGSVSLVNSAGLWSLASMGLFLSSTNWDLDDRQWQLSMMLAADLGMAGGVWAARQVDVSRSRVLIVDSAGLLGGLLGAGVYVLGVGEGVNGRALAGATLAGVLVGLGTGIAVTQHWDAPSLDRLTGQPVVVPVNGGAIVGWAGPL